MVDPGTRKCQARRLPAAALVGLLGSRCWLVGRLGLILLGSGWGSLFFGFVFCLRFWGWGVVGVAFVALKANVVFYSISWVRTQGLPWENEATNYGLMLSWLLASQLKKYRKEQTSENISFNNQWCVCEKTVSGMLNSIGNSLHKQGMVSCRVVAVRLLWRLVPESGFVWDLGPKVRSKFTFNKLL